MKRKWKWAEIKARVKWKSPAAMLTLLFAGLGVVLLVSGPHIWEQWRLIEQLKGEQSALEMYIADGQKRLDEEEPHPMEPLDEHTLIRLQEQLPLEEDVPRFTAQLSEAARQAGMTLNGLHVARSEELLNKKVAHPGLLPEGDEDAKEPVREQEEAQKDEAHEKDNEASEGERSELLQFSADSFSKEVDATARTEIGVERLWADVYLEGSYTHLADFFSRLKQQPRLTEVVAWRYVLPRDGVPSNIRVRLNVLYYVDDRLTDLPSLPELDIPEGSGQPIRVLPEEPQTEEKEDHESRKGEDGPFFVPYPFVPNEDGTGFVPYPWEPGEEFPALEPPPDDGLPADIDVTEEKGALPDFAPGDN